ncbi:MAG: hypothetical protein WCI72_03485 [archaeon]
MENGKDYWMSSGRLYSAIESDMGFRLSGAEKMLLLRECGDSLEKDWTSYFSTVVETLELFGYSSNTLDNWKEEQCKKDERKAGDLWLIIHNGLKKKRK